MADCNNIRSMRDEAILAVGALIFVKALTARNDAVRHS